MLEEIFQQAKEASIDLALLDNDTINKVLLAVADQAIEATDTILAANAKDLSRMDEANPMYDRLKLTRQRIEGIAGDTRNVASLPSPLGKVLKHAVLPNGLDIKRVSVPFGVIGIVYEARPNVTFDVFSLCLKAGSACILKGGKDADDSNRAIVSLIQSVLKDFGINEHAITLMPATHEATGALLHANGYVDLVIPRGSKRLIDFVRQEASVPVIETGAGVCHAYFDKDGDLEKGARIINNAKTRRVSVCNALDCTLVHVDRLADLPVLVAPLAEHSVELHADAEALAALRPHYPAELLVEAEDEHCRDTEWMDYKMGVYVVDGLDAAIAHIARHGSGHSESIVTEDAAAAERFRRMVDASCVYVNLPTSFTDGGQFGLGAEIGISTQKLGPRGPMGLRAITTTKYLLTGRGQTRP